MKIVEHFCPVDPLYTGLRPLFYLNAICKSLISLSVIPAFFCLCSSVRPPSSVFVCVCVCVRPLIHPRIYSSVCLFVDLFSASVDASSQHPSFCLFLQYGCVIHYRNELSRAAGSVCSSWAIWRVRWYPASSPLQKAERPCAIDVISAGSPSQGQDGDGGR